jgi:hypothetical protein
VNVIANTTTTPLTVRCVLDPNLYPTALIGRSVRIGWPRSTWRPAVMIFRETRADPGLHRAGLAAYRPDHPPGYELDSGPGRRANAIPGP